MLKWFILLTVVAHGSANSAEHGVTQGSRGTSCRCGWANRNSQNKIVGGTFYRENEYPFIAGIARARNGGYAAFCGGSIITANHVITVAHCTDSYLKNGTPIFVLLGTHDRSKPNSNAVIIQVQRIAQRGWNDKTKAHDIALLTLSQSIRFNNIIGPVCMPLPGLDVPGQTVRILGGTWIRSESVSSTHNNFKTVRLNVSQGWGAEKFQGFMTTRPKKLDTTHVTAAACAAAWPNFVRRNNPLHICTLSKRESACQGDSGGPVVWRDPQTNRYTLVGLVSFGPACTDSRPSVQTKVEPYLSWIQSQISQSRPASTCRKL